MAIFKRRLTKREQVQKKREERRTYRAQQYHAKIQRRCWERFLGYLGFYRKNILLILVLIFVASALETLLPQIVRFVLDKIVPQKDFRLLTWIILGGTGAYSLHALFRYYEQRSVVDFSLGLITKVRRDLFSYQLKLPLSYFEKYNTGKLISKVTYSTLMIKMLVETFAYVCLREMTLIAMIVVAAFFIDWKLTLVFFALTPFIVFYVHRLNRYMGKVAQILQTKNDQILKVLDHTYHAVKLFRVFGKEEQQVQKFEKVLLEDKKYRVERTMVYAGNAILISLLTSLLTLAALWFGGREMILKKMSYGQVMAYIIYLGMLFRPISELVRASAYLQAGKIGIYTIFSVYENFEPIEDSPNPRVPGERKGAIAFSNVWFNYPTVPMTLKNFNLRIEAGQKVLIVGPSGSGKSTLFNLLLRLYECERGIITLDGINIRRIPLNALKDYYSMVMQDQLHLEDSVISNISLGSEDDEFDAQLESALALSQEMDLDRKITRRDKKFGQTVAAGGLGFSRGELQKMAVMRAAQRKAPVILLDEPSSSMDPHSEGELLDFINRSFVDRTVVMISHRPVPKFRADWIVVMRGGNIEAQGTHFYLLNHSDYYQRLSHSPSPAG